VTHTSSQVKWEIGNFPEEKIDYYLLSYVRADGDGQENAIRTNGMEHSELL